MKYDRAIHHRCSIRFQGYDYPQAGVYFVTICAHNKECLFGDIVDGEMRLNNVGRLVCDEWIKTKTAEIRDEIELDEWVVMPNRFHGILSITNGRGDPPVAPTIRESSLGYGVEAWMV